MRGDRPTFAMVTPTADAEARRIVSVDTFRALTGLTTTDLSDAGAELMLDGVLADCARSCLLAAAGAYPLTLAQEVVSATWVDASAMGYNWVSTYLPGGRGHQLLVPWRAPITLIEITEGGTELEQDTDFRYLGAGVIERISSGVPCGWSARGIVVEYTAGWLVDDETFPVPADLVTAICDQVRLKYNQRGTDFTLRSEDVPGVWSGSYNVPGGDAISTSGLMRPLEDALAPFRGGAEFRLMSDVYAPKRARVAAILSRWNSGVVTLTRVTHADPEPETPWIPGAATTVVYTLDARVDGVAAEYVDDTTILATDRMVIASPKATAADGTVSDLVPRMSDTLQIDGSTKVIKKIMPVPAAGAAARFHIFVAS